MTPEDCAAVHAAAFVQGRPWSAAEFRDLLDAAHSHTSCHAHGFALWRAIAGEAELLTIAVHPDQQGRGIGADLMRDWMRAAASQADTAFLEVAADNGPARALYDRFGFAVVARRPGYYGRGDTRTDALVMRAPLPFAGAPDLAD